MVTGKQAGAATLLIATFAVGAVVGRVSARWSDASATPRARTENRVPGARLTATLQRELTLSPVQRDSVQAILTKWDPAMRAVWDGMRPKFDSLRVLVRADIRQVLTEDQKAAFQRWSARQDSVARNRSREENRGR
jgi:hypothetical protein